MPDIHPPSLLARDFETVATFSWGLARTPHVQTLLGARQILVYPDASQAKQVSCVVGWGQKDNTHAAQAFATEHGLPYVRVEDGFLRSVNLSGPREGPLSIVLDDLGIYYDATGPSRLEHILQNWGSAAREAAALCARAERMIGQIRAHRLSKYNNAPVDAPMPRYTRDERVLVVDQTYGDMSVRLGLVDEDAFEDMVERALDEHPHADIVVKTHPDVIAGKKRGYLGHVPKHPRITLLSSSINPLALLEQMTHVHVATSQLGFEALLLGKHVTTFGVPFYAGWGLTHDRRTITRRTERRTLNELFAAAYLLYPRYLDPDTEQRGQLEDVINHLARQRAEFARNSGHVYCSGFQLFKRNYVRAYLRSPGNRVEFVRSARQARRKGFHANAKLLVWGTRETDAIKQLATEHGVGVWRMEDGFLRSVGLGSDLIVPASLVVDRFGIYYDPRTPSELEHILSTAHFARDELARARALRAIIVAQGLSKYNFAASKGALARPPAVRVILVPGQVEDDASIQLGCLDVRTNLDLLRAVRAQSPDAYVIFKPHPDVTTKNRRGHVPERDALRFADSVVTDVPLPLCFGAVDEVHTMTSLSGFEALLRGLRVQTYGQPFYAGWGLTTDRHPHPRRTRTLSLDELVAGTLLRYPRYLNTQTGRFTTPEHVVAQLQRELASRRATLEKPWLVRQLLKARYALEGMTREL